MIVRRNPCMQARFLFEKFISVARNQGIPVLFKFNLRFFSDTQFHQECILNENENNKNSLVERNTMYLRKLAAAQLLKDYILACLSNFPYNPLYILTTLFLSNDFTRIKPPIQQNKKVGRQEISRRPQYELPRGFATVGKSCTDTQPAY